MKKLIKDEIYHSPFYLIVSAPEKLNQIISRQVKDKQEWIEESRGDAKWFNLIEGEKNYFIWMHEVLWERDRNGTMATLSHELSHHVDIVFDDIGMLQSDKLGDITEARAYYFEYLLRQVLKYLYKS